MKYGILRSLIERNCHITIVPYNYSASQILRLKPEEIVLTNGTADPRELKETIQTVRDILGKIPLFAIGLGMHIFALASGAKTRKMFVSHSGPYVVKKLLKDYTFMMTQNHHYDILKSS